MPAPRSSLVRSVARRIKSARAARGLTQEQVAARLRTATKNYQRMESGRQNLTLETLQAVAGALEIDAHELLAAGAGPQRTADSPLRAALRQLQKVGHEVSSAREDLGSFALPVVDLQASASRFAGAAAVQVRAWVVLADGGLPAGEGRFIAQVQGRSMEPRVPSGALCLFRGPVTGNPEGKLVLVQLRQASDPETGGAYALKRIGALSLRSGGGFRVRLESLNPDVPAFTVDVEQPSDLVFLAELERVLVPEPRNTKLRRK